MKHASLAACLFAVAGLIAFQSCGDDEDGEKDEPVGDTGVGGSAGGVNGGAAAGGDTSSPQPAKCVSRDVVFTHVPTDMESIDSITPLPAFPGGRGLHNRHYMHVKASFDGVLVPIYAPTAMTLYGAAHYKPDGAPADYLPEWALAFEASCDVTVSYAHVKVASDKIDAVYDLPVSSSSGTTNVTRVDFAAGEVIGWYKRGSGSIAWDFLVNDKRVTNAFVTPARFKDSVLEHAVSPQALYQDPALKASFDGLFGEPYGKIAGATAGTVAIDVPETAAGYWSKSADPASGIAEAHTPGNPYGSPLALFRQTTGAIYITNLNTGDPALDFYSVQRVEAGAPTHLDPKELTVGESHCYDLGSEHVWVQLAGVAELRVAIRPEDDCTSSFPTSGYETYYR